jgi:hypothetical protein
MKDKKMVAWDVINKVKVGSVYQSKVVDTVFYTPDCDAEYVYRSLVQHDGYPSNIIVRRHYE